MVRSNGLRCRTWSRPYPLARNWRSCGNEKAKIGEPRGVKRFTRPAPTSQRCGKEKAELNFPLRARTPNLASSLSLGCQDLLTDPHFIFPIGRRLFPNLQAR